VFQRQTGLLQPEECTKAACLATQNPAVDNCYPAADNYQRVNISRSWNTGCSALATGS